MTCTPQSVVCLAVPVFARRKQKSVFADIWNIYICTSFSLLSISVVISIDSHTEIDYSLVSAPTYNTPNYLETTHKVINGEIKYGHNWNQVPCGLLYTACCSEIGSLTSLDASLVTCIQWRQRINFVSHPGMWYKACFCHVSAPVSALHWWGPHRPKQRQRCLQWSVPICGVIQNGAQYMWSEKSRFTHKYNSLFTTLSFTPPRFGPFSGAWMFIKWACWLKVEASLYVWWMMEKDNSYCPFPKLQFSINFSLHFNQRMLVSFFLFCQPLSGRVLPDRPPDRGSVHASTITRSNQYRSYDVPLVDNIHGKQCRLCVPTVGDTSLHNYTGHGRLAVKLRFTVKPWLFLISVRVNILSDIEQLNYRSLAWLFTLLNFPQKQPPKPSKRPHPKMQNDEFMVV